MKDGWYSRPVLFVESVERAIAFYRDRLGFVEGSGTSRRAQCS